VVGREKRIIRGVLTACNTGAVFFNEELHIMREFILGYLSGICFSIAVFLLVLLDILEHELYVMVASGQVACKIVTLEDKTTEWECFKVD